MRMITHTLAHDHSRTPRSRSLLPPPPPPSLWHMRASGIQTNQMQVRARTLFTSTCTGTGKMSTRQPVLLKSAQSFSRFLMLLSECIGKARLMSSILILLGVSGLFQNRRYIKICGDMQVKLFYNMPSKMHLQWIDTFLYKAVFIWMSKRNGLKRRNIFSSSHKTNRGELAFFSRAFRQLHVITASFDRFTGSTLCSAIAITSILVLWYSRESCSIHQQCDPFRCMHLLFFKTTLELQLSLAEPTIRPIPSLKDRENIMLPTLKQYFPLFTTKYAFAVKSLQDKTFVSDNLLHERIRLRLEKILKVCGLPNRTLT